MTSTQVTCPEHTCGDSQFRQSLRPDFFIVGAPRCGTTALYRWLRKHPQVFLPIQKECHYFAEDLNRYRTIQNEKAYLSMFQEVDECHQAVGEASVMYLSSQVAIENILAFNPDAKVVVTLRNPLEMLPSWHDQLLVTFQEDISDFSQAWAAQVQRKDGDLIPATCKVPEALRYACMGRLGAQVDRLLKQCDRQQIHFVLYEDLCEQPSETYKRLLSYLGVDFDGQQEFPRINQNREIQSPWLRQIWQHSRPLRRRLQFARKVLGDSLYDRTRDQIVPRISRPKLRQPMSSSMSEMLKSEFYEDIHLLSMLVKRDLSHWLAGRMT